jgi:MoaA/NifB/PqqE/SkfB family radical SAM enzyme
VARTNRVIRALLTRKMHFEVDRIPFEFENMSFKKILNWLLTEVSVFFKPTVPWGFPALLQVEPTSRCNLQCPFCPVTLGIGRPSGHMSLELFQKIIDELGHYLLLILFWDWGEPFLNPQAYDMIRYAHQRGIKVVSSTNGHVFASGYHAREVVESGLDALIFSVDGITDESYRKYRSHGSLEMVLEGIRRVVAEKERLKCKHPIVNFRYIVMKHNERDIGVLENIVRSLGVDMLVLRKYHAAHSSHQAGMGWESDFLPTDVRYRLPAFTDQDGGPLRAGKNPCRNLWNCPTVHWNGTVCSCFADPSEEHPLGSLEQQRFRDIWRGASFRNLRREFRRRWQGLPLCGACTYGYEGGDIGRESDASVEWLTEQQCSPKRRR